MSGTHMAPRILSFTSLYPNPRAPFDGLFVRARLVAMAKAAPVHALIPILWRPGSSPAGENGFYSEIQDHDGLAASYHRFFNIPRYFKRSDARLMAASMRSAFREAVASFRPDIVDAHWAYPDGVAAAQLAREAGLPYSITVRGDDLNVFLDTTSRRAQIIESLRGAACVIAVCEDLARTARSMGVEHDRAVVAPNGVDTALFHPTDRDAARKQLDLPADRPIILSVGRISPEKGYELILDAMVRMGQQDAPILAIVGKRNVNAGYEATLLRRIEELGLQSRVLVPGPAKQETLREWYSAADVSCLASTREGWPNVILESFACGCPVVASNVGGVPEVIENTGLGTVAERSAAAFATALSDALTRTWDRVAIRRHAEARTWDATGKRCVEILSRQAQPPGAATV